MSLHRWLRPAPLLVAFVLPAAAPTAGRAQDAPAANAEHSALFKKLDTDADGKLTKEEIPEDQRRLFERLLETQDKDQDGKLTAAEFGAGLSEGRPRAEAGAGPRGERPGMAGSFNPDDVFARADRNGDGKVSVDEVPEERREAFQAMLARVDENKDGAASREEFRRGFGGAGPAGRPGNPGSQGVPGGPPMSGSGLFGALDKDRNGELSADEIAGAADALKRLDRDGDGKLTQRELAGSRPEGAAPAAGFQPDPERMLAFYKQQDRNGDGKLSKDEVPERLRENFAAVDGNGDGALDETELRQMTERFARGAGARRPEQSQPGGDDGARRFAESDRNGDGKLSKDELPERVRERFADLDTDGDGFISPPEMREAGRRLMQRREGEGGRPEGRRPETRRPDGRQAEPAKSDKPAESAVPKKDDKSQK